MSIQSVIGNFVNDVGNDLTAIFTTAKTQIENIIGSASTSLSNIWDGGFAGISEQGVEDIKEALRKYCATIEEQIASFDEEGNISNAYKGAIQEAARDFIRSIKDLLQAYVSTMKVSIDDATVAYQNYSTGAQSIASNVTSDAESIRSQASQVRLD